MPQFHFFSGLPRPGSTLLSAILRQNSRFEAGTPGLHTVRRKVHAEDRQTVLPPDIFKRFENDALWRNPETNVQKVSIV